MSLSLSAVGYTSPISFFTYDWKATALYALGIGAKKEELTYLYEGLGPRVYPTFAVVPVIDAVMACLSQTGGNLSKIIHTAQAIRLSRALPAHGRIDTRATITGVYDLKRMAQVNIATHSFLPDGEPLFETTWSILYLGEGGFSGPPPPKSAHPSAPKDRKPDFRVEEATSPEQALLYRLSGDLNPLHADPAFAKDVGFPDGPILHGLCTYGFVARALIREGLAGNEDRLRSFSGNFRKPVSPGDTLVTQGFFLDEGRVALTVHVKDKPDAVMTGVWAEIAPQRD